MAIYVSIMNSLYFIFIVLDGEVFSFGKSARGRLGRSDQDTMTPKRVNIVSDELFAVVSISSSHGTTLLATRRKLNFYCRVFSGFFFYL